MPHLRPTALAGLVLALAPVAALTSCGFDYPTDRVNTIGSGANNREGDVDALGIRILATSTGEGRLIGALANNLDDAASLDAVTVTEGSVTVADFEPVEVAGNAGVNLVDLPPIEFSGDFTAGNFLPLELEFSTGDVVSLDAPVVKPCFQYTQVPTEAPEETESVKGETAGDAADAEAEEALESETHSEDDHAEGGDATFNCADEAPEPESAH